MKLNDKVYDVLKWVCLIVLPAIAVLLSALGNTWEWNIPTSQIVSTISAIQVFLGALLGISCATYNAENGSDKNE